MDREIKRDRERERGVESNEMKENVRIELAKAVQEWIRVIPSMKSRRGSSDKISVDLGAAQEMRSLAPSRAETWALSRPVRLKHLAVGRGRDLTSRVFMFRWTSRHP